LATVNPVTVADLVARTRLESGLRNNQYWTNDDIVLALSQAGAELYDIFTSANQHYVISEFDFTTTGPSDSIVTLPSDFQQGHSLDIYPQTYDGVATPNNQTRSIRYLSNWLNRNQTGPVAVFAPSGRDPVYTFLGGQLRFYPENQTPAAQFKLYYTPMWVPLAPPTTVSWTLVAGANAADNAGFIQYNFGSTTGDHPTFVDAMDGGTLTVTFDVINEDYNCTSSLITGPDPFGNGNTAYSSTAWPGGSFTNPASGTASITYQAAGTTNTLPTVMAPWSEYLVVHASIAINIDRQRPCGELEAKLERLKARVNSVIDNRQEEPMQPPLTRGNYGVPFSGGGWDW